MKYRWPCEYVNSKCETCEAPAVKRLHFSTEHPFNHVDCCELHASQYANVDWEHPISQEWGLIASRSEYDEQT